MSTTEEIFRDLKNRLQTVLGDSDLDSKKNYYPLSEPYFAGREKELVNDCIETGWVSSAGKYVDEFETKLAEYTGAKYAILASNGTSALHLAYIGAGIEVDDEVLVPALTFVGTVNPIHYMGAIPHFVDVDHKTLGVDAEKLKTYLKDITKKKSDGIYNKNTNRRISALIVMHTFGHAVDLEACKSVCDEFDIALIEDAAEALGTKYKGQHIGHYGAVGAISFNGNKIITTGGGGAVLTNDEGMFKYLKHLSTTAKQPHKFNFYHDDIGYNYRLPNLNSALGLAQIEQLDQFIAAKKKLTDRYRQVFKDIGYGSIYTEPDHSDSNQWLVALLLNDESVRDQLLTKLNDINIFARPVWTLMNKLPMNKNCPTMDLSVSEDLEKKIINLPSSVALGMK